MRHLVALVAVAGALALPAAAHGQASFGAPNQRATSPTMKPPGFSVNAGQALAIADRTEAAHSARERFPELSTQVFVWTDEWWQVLYHTNGHVRLEVDVARGGGIHRIWSGVQAESYVSRTSLDPVLNKPWFLALLGLLSLAPFFDRRRWRRVLHLDLLVLSGLTVAIALLNGGHGRSALYVIYAALVYLAVRAARAGFRRRGEQGPVVAWKLPTAVMAVALLLVVGGRVALNVTSHQTSDVALASVVGVDRIVNGQPLYVDNDAHGDTYGPITYAAYTPFEAAFPYRGRWDRLPAAHAAAITFDLLTMLFLFLLGGRLRPGRQGRRLGLALAWAWAVCPATLDTLTQSTHDGLIAAITSAMLLAFARPAVRGALLGLAAAAKFFPAALLGAVWYGRHERPVRSRVVTTAACVAMFAFACLAYMPEGGVKTLWNCTLGFQLTRQNDFSLWLLHPGLSAVKTAVVGLALLFAVVVGFWPRGGRTLAQAAGLGAAVTIALELGGGHWAFFYVCWFLPGLLVALFDATEPHAEVEPAALAELEEPELPAPREAAIMA